MNHMLTVVFAIASGLAVGNLYWAQPLLAQISASFGVDASQGGLLVTATQIGYALGILLIVPLGDVLHRRKLISTMIFASVAALIASALAPSFLVLSITLACLGIATVSGQIILPLAGDLAKPSERGQIVGIVSAGITLGILTARTISGLVAEVLGWHAIYLIAATLNFILALIILKTVPDKPKQGKVSYPALIIDVFRCLPTTPTLLRVMVTSGLAFGIVFNLFWTSITFLLSAEPYNFSTLQIGLVSLAGITGGIASLKIGVLQDRGLGIPALGVFFAICLACMVAAFFCGGSLIALIIIAAIHSFGVQGVSILNQARLFTLNPLKRSRLNTCFVVNNFIFAAIGNVLATTLWNAGGWQAVMAGAIIASVAALLIWALSRKSYQEFDRNLPERMEALMAESKDE